MKNLRNLRTVVIPFAALICFSSICLAYVRSSTGTGIPLIRTDNTAIQFQLNTSVKAGAQSSASGKTVTVISANSDPQAAVRNALAAWNGVTTANVKFLPLISTTAVINSGDRQMTIAIGSTASDVSIVGGALAITVNSFNTANGAILDSDIIISPGIAFSTDGSTANDLQSVMTHELGHSLGANHTGLLGASMFQFNSGQRFLTTDDLAFVNSAYPLASGGVAFGTISGSITASGAGVPYGLITATDTSAGVTVGGVTNPDGAYSMNVPPGTYQMYAEPLNGAVPINIYLTALQAAAAAAVQFQTTSFGPAVSVAANATTTANLSVTPGAATLATPYVTVTPVNGPVSTAAAGGPATVPSGGSGSVDLVLSGPGFDATLKDSNFTIIGQGITLHAGSVRVDKSQNFSGFNLLRVTLDVAARSNPSLASFIVTTGAGSVSFSGALVIVPPTPTFVSKGVISAASFLGSPGGDGAVSPGGIYSVYDIPNVPNLGPAAFVVNGPYDAYGNLATILGGVSVTFDGIPAPMFLSYGGQLNLQAPFEVAGKKSTKVVVNYLGSPSAAITVPVLAVQPGFFTSDGKAVRAYNLKDHTINAADNPAAKGDLVEVYGTGVGQITAYSVLTGQGAPAPPGGYTGNYTYSIGGSAPAAALYGGWTPTAAGLAQWDLQIPATSASGAVPISVTDSSGATSQPGATIFVK